MASFIDATRYRALRDQLVRLYGEPVRDMKAIDKVIDEISREQLALNARNGQPGSNPIEPSRRIVPTQTQLQR